MNAVRLAAVTILLISVSLASADPPSAGKSPAVASLKPFAQIDGILAALSGDTITIKVPGIEQKSSGRSRMRISLTRVEKEHEYDLAGDVRFRMQHLPKGPDGKARHFAPDEYARLREPAGAPGYKADRADFHSGQIVRVYLGRESPRDRPVVMNVLLIKDGPKIDEKPADKPKKKSKP